MFARRIFTRSWVAVLVLTLTCLSNAFAVPVIWTLSGVTFNDGGTATGSFVYDADLVAVSAWSINTAGGNTTTFPPFPYSSTMASTPTQAPFGSIATSPYFGLIFGISTPSHFTLRSLQLPVSSSSSLTDAGGTVPIDTSGGYAYECNGCAYPQRSITAGNLIGTPATAPSITSANAIMFTVGTAGSFTVTSTSNLTAALSESGTLPSGVTFTDNGDGTATLAGTPAAGSGGTYALTFTASNGAPPDATQAFTLTVGLAPTITSANATTFTVGTAGSFTVTSTGAPAAALSESGTLPPGVTFTDNGNGTATLAGTPAAGSAGTYALTFTANDGVAPNATQAFTLTVSAPLAVTSTPALTWPGEIVLLLMLLGAAFYGEQRMRSSASRWRS